MQERIRKVVLDIYPRQSDLVSRLQSVLNLSERTVYHRLEGNTPFTVDELDKIMKAFKIPPELIFAEEEAIPLFNKFPNRQEIIDDMLTGWLAAVNRMKAANSSQIFMISNYLPFSVALDFPELIKFRLYFILQSYFPENRFFEEKFDSNSPWFKNVEKLSIAISRIFYSISSTEVWGPSTTLICLNQLEFLMNRSAISIQDAKVILRDLKKLVKLIEKYARSGKKELVSDTGLIGTSTNYDLYYNSTYHVDEYTLLSSIKDGEEELYIFHPIHGVITSPLEKAKISQYAKILIYTGDRFTGQSNEKIQNCFDNISNNLKKLEDKLEG